MPSTALVIGSQGHHKPAWTSWLTVMIHGSSILEGQQGTAASFGKDF